MKTIRKIFALIMSTVMIVTTMTITAVAEKTDERNYRVTGASLDKGYQICIENMSVQEFNCINEVNKKGGIIQISVGGGKRGTVKDDYNLSLILNPYFTTANANANGELIELDEVKYEKVGETYTFIFRFSDKKIFKNAQTWTEAYVRTRFIVNNKVYSYLGYLNDMPQEKDKNNKYPEEVLAKELDIEASSAKNNPVAEDKNEDSTKNVSTLDISKPKSQSYTGKSKTPDVTIKDGNYTLKKGTDYTLTYKNNKKIGKATVTIKGKGKYTGSKSVTFNIVPKKVTLKASKGDDSVKLSWTKVTGAEKYQIYYSVNGGKYKKLTTTSKLTKTVKGLDFSKNSYKFKVRAVAEGNDGKTYTGPYSGVKSFKKG